MPPKWQHDETGRITECDASPGPRWMQIDHPWPEPPAAPEVVANLRVYDFRDEDGGERRTDAEATGFAGKLPPGVYELVLAPTVSVVRVDELADLLHEAHDQLHHLVTTFVPGNDDAYAGTTDLMRRIREAMPSVAFDGGAAGVGVPKEAEPRIVECDLCALRRNADTCPVFRCPHKPAAGVALPHGGQN